MTDDFDGTRLRKIFFPYATERHDDVSGRGTRFVHYTSADAAMNIVRSKEVWMRKTSCMDDYMEVEHGIECLLRAYKSESGKRFKESLERTFSGICREIEELFNGWLPHLKNDT